MAGFDGRMVRLFRSPPGLLAIGCRLHRPSRASCRCQAVQVHQPAHPGSSARSAPWPCPGQCCAPACRPCRCSGRRTRAPPAPEPSIVALLLPLRQRLGPLALAVEPALQPLGLQRHHDRRRPVGAVPPDLGGRVVPVQDVIHHLAVVHRRVGHTIPAHQLVPAVHADVVLVAVVALAVLPGASVSFWARLAGLSAQPAGVPPPLIIAFSSWRLRCLGTGTIAASGRPWPGSLAGSGDGRTPQTTHGLSARLIEALTAIKLPFSSYR